jgi:hypothetical protein
MSNNKNPETPLVPTFDWTPPKTARIEANPPRPRTFAESTMSDEDYAAAQEYAKAGLARSGELIDWGPMSVSKIPSKEK